MIKYVIAADSAPDRIAQVGPLIPGSWSRHDDELGREARGEFLIDTGAYGAMIDLDVAEALQLPSHGGREVHGIHGYGRLKLYFARISLPARDEAGSRTDFTTTLECVAVPSLGAKNREHGVEIIGILGRIFLRGSHLSVDGVCGRIELAINGAADCDRR